MFEFGKEEDMIGSQSRIKLHKVRRWLKKSIKSESPLSIFLLIPTVCCALCLRSMMCACTDPT